METERVSQPTGPHNLIRHGLLPPSSGESANLGNADVLRNPKNLHRSMRKRRRKWLYILGACLLPISTATFWLFQEVEYRRVVSPDGSYTAIVTYRRYESLKPKAPGRSSDKAGFIRIVDNRGIHYGKIPVPMVWMSDDLQWPPGGARLPLVGEWDFAKREYRYRDSSEAEIVRTAQ
jgi:hypothetical protein